jgi:uncharacterized membrane protein YozB (DUF420 family)
MDVGLRILTGIVIAQIAATFLLLLLQHEPSTSPLTLDFREEPLIRKTATISITHYFFSCAFLLIGMALFTRGIMEAHRRGAMALLSILGMVYILAILAIRPSLGAGITLFVNVYIFGEGSGEPTIAIERARNAQSRKGADVSRQRPACVRLSARS